MKVVLNKLKRSIKQILGLFPSALPTGASSFYAWADDLGATYTLPTHDKDSIYFALGTMIMHLGPTAAFRSKYYFVLALRAGAAKQVAGQVFYDIKQKQKAAEATAPLQVVADGPQAS